MATTLSTLLLVAAVIASETSAAGSGYYRAAVVDYKVLRNANLTAHQNLMTNVMEYKSYIEKAHEQSADIIVFPETGLLGKDKSLFLTIPDPAQKIIPANNASYDESIQTLSSYAKTYAMYIAVNIHENYTDHATKTVHKYNTNVVFDRNGTVVARYRKFNLYGEKLSITDTPEYSYFDTDFNVRFGQFICFDILFKEPALTLIKDYNVTNFIYPSKWFSELPFLTSVQAQWMWAVGNNVNLLSSGNNDIAVGSGGSSIIRGKNAKNVLSVFTDQSKSTLLVGDVPSGVDGKGSGKVDFISQNATGETPFPFIQQRALEKMTSAIIVLPTNTSSTNFKNQLCNNQLCCSFDVAISYDKESSTKLTLRYRAVVFDGRRSFGIMTDMKGVQLCGILSCTNDSIVSCGSQVFNKFPLGSTPVTQVNFTSIDISGNFTKKDANILPNVLLWPNAANEFFLRPSDVSLTSEGTTTNFSMKPNRQIVTAGIHSRVFSRDGNYNAGGNSGAFSTNFALVALLLPLILPILLSYVGYGINKE